ncbi:MAG TPA: hypothetical protein VLD65_03290, partial [Anaerolineales bacterium]|nr:hypothetical protein [Anaerolineales bacterium]
MSRKQFQNLHFDRLDALFADLGHGSSDLPATSGQTVTGWTWECNSDGQYTDCSPEVEAILGISAKEFINQPVTRFRLAPDSMAVLKSALDSKSYPIEVTANYVAQNGELISVLLSIIAPAHSAIGNGKSHGWRGYARVIVTELPIPGVGMLDEAVFLPPPSPPGQTKKQPRIKPATQKARPAELSHALPADGIAKVDVSTLLEILDQSNDRFWSDDERLLVEQVASQLTLALDNARLFQENVNLLEETRQRNEELTTLNRI